MERGYLIVLTTALISGFAIFINKFGVGGFNPFVYAGARNIIVAVLLFSAIALFGKWKSIKALSRRDWRNLIIIGMVGGSIPFLLYFYALKMTSATTASFIHKTMFIYVAVIAFFALKERLSRWQIFGTLGLLAGVALLIGLPAQLDTGAALLALATLFWACENVISKHVLKTLEPMVVAFGRMFFGSLVIFGFLFVSGDIAFIAAITLEQLGWMIFTVVFLFSYVVTWYHGLARIRVSEATAILVVGALVTPLLGLGATLTLEKWMGILLILAGTVLLVISSVKAGKVLASGVRVVERSGSPRAFKH